MSRIFHLDPHPIVRLGLARLLERHPSIELVGHVGDKAQAQARLLALKPDLVVTEIAFADGGGIRFLSDLVRRLAGGRVLVLSGEDEQLYAERCLRAGACGFLHKAERENRLINGIEAALAGEVVASETIAQRLVRRALLGDENGEGCPIARLSDRELEVFELMSTGLNTRAIAAQLSVSPKTVESHKARIKEKTGARDATELLTLAVSWRVSGGLS